jgi:hypothetical protein
MGILEMLYLANKAAGYAAELYDKVQSGDMTEAEAIAAWKANAAKVAEEGERFDRLAG